MKNEKYLAKKIDNISNKQDNNHQSRRGTLPVGRRA